MKRVFLLLSICCSVVCFGSPVKSMLGAEGTEQQEEASSYTAQDYIQDGLIAHWDGIENITYGVHDGEATVCYDLISGLALPCQMMSQDVVQALAQTFFSSIDLSGDMTIEWVVSAEHEVWSGIGTYNWHTTLRFRYQISGVREGYRYYQIRYWDGSQQVTKYSIPKTVLQGSVSYGGGMFFVYSYGDLVAVYGDAAAVEDSSEFFIHQGFPFRCIRVYSRSLSEEEIGYNHSIDMKRFGGSK